MFRINHFVIFKDYFKRFIYFDINPENIDVNIHPTKTEIKFADEQLIYPILLATIREALGKFNLTPSLDFDVAGKPELPLISHADHPSFERPQTTHTGSYNPFHTAHTSSPVKDWQNLYVAPERHEPVAPAIPIPVSISDAKLLQLMERYILLPTSEGLLLVNQHRAHVCLLYDLCLKRLNDHDGEVQQLLFPDTWDVDKADQHLVESIKEDLRGLGFDLEILTPGCYSVSGIPAILNGQNAIPVLQHILDTLRETGLSMRDKWLTKVALSMAQSAAIPYGKTLTAMEMKQLLDDLFAREDYLRTPDGKPTMTLLSDEQLKRLFL